MAERVIHRSFPFAARCRVFFPSCLSTNSSRSQCRRPFVPRARFEHHATFVFVHHLRAHSNERRRPMREEEVSCHAHAPTCTVFNTAPPPGPSFKNHRLITAPSPPSRRLSPTEGSTWPLHARNGIVKQTMPTNVNDLKERETERKKSPRNLSLLTRLTLVIQSHSFMATSHVAPWLFLFEPASVSEVLRREQ